VKLFAQIVLSFVVLYLTTWSGMLWYGTFVQGGLYANLPAHTAALGCLVPFMIVGIAMFSMACIKVWWWPFWAFVLLASGCSYASANVQTLVSDDCGKSWRLIPVGQSVPVRHLACEYKVTVPDYPMSGETRFKTSFKERVLALVETSYEYVIADAKVFIGEAKYLGRANADSEDASNIASAYESAENTIIDKRIRDAATDMLRNQDIVDFSQAEFEDALLAEVNKRLEDKGVRLNFISFVPIPEEQTRLAIDTLTAMRVYETRGLAELGRSIIVAKAGAAKTDVSVNEQK
jgi:hypothetical protein